MSRVHAQKVHFGMIILFFCGLYLFTPGSSSAQEVCGNIIEYYDGEPYSQPIEDCGNPFGLVEPNPDIEIYLGETLILQGGEYSFLNMPGNWNIEGSSAFFVSGTLYLHEGDDYILKDEFVGGDSYTFSEEGTYTLVIYEEDEPILSRGGLLQEIYQILIPTAWASVGPAQVLTFSVVDAEPQGAPSVLFLPGIQASRLYTDGALGTENQLWEPNINGDVEKLALTETGESINEIYTRDVIDSILGGDHIYEDLLAYLETQKEAGTISDWEAFAYDWRYDVFDVVSNGTQYEGQKRNPVDIIEQLAESTHSKVTIIAHSNGGLLAKALMIALEGQGKAGIVERVIFLASPHIGTPESIGTILHGYDQEKLGGYVIDDETAREVIMNMPAAYGLLPSDPYYTKTTTPVIVFDETPATELWRNKWGSEINDSEELSSFMLDSEGGREDPEDIYMPSVANEAMLLDAMEKHTSMLDNWQAPPDVGVYEIVGTGLNTIDYFTYEAFQRKECSFGFINCEIIDYVKPIPHFTQRGDQTVLSVSAEAYSGEKMTYYVDLKELDDFDIGFEVVHANMGESPQVQALIANIITGESADIPFIYYVSPEYDTERDVISGHSPISLRVEDSEGNTIEKRREGSTTEILTEIPGSRYLEFAGGIYIILPSNTNYTVTVTGEEEGSYTLRVERLSGTSHSELLSEYALATSTPEMRATFQKEDGIFSTLAIDLDGDGKTDMETTLNGELVQEEITYQTLYTAIKSLELRRYQEKILLSIAKIAERFSQKAELKQAYKKKEERTLGRLKKILRVYQRVGFITEDEEEELNDIINELENK